MPPEALLIMTACWAISAIAALSIALPQSVLLVRTTFARDKNWWLRLKTTLLFGSIGIAAGRTAAILIDYLWFDQAWFGPLESRWAGDLTLAVAVTTAVVLAAVLFWQIQFEREP